MNFPLTSTNTKYNTKTLSNPLNTSFFEFFITQFEKELSQQVNLLSVNNSLSFKNHEKRFFENNQILKGAYDNNNIININDMITNNPAISDLFRSGLDQAQFPCSSWQADENVFASKQLAESVYFTNFVDFNSCNYFKNNDFFNAHKKDSSCNFDNLNLNEFQEFSAKQSKRCFNNSNANAAFAESFFCNKIKKEEEEKKQLLQQQENYNFPCKLDFLNDFRSEIIAGAAAAGNLPSKNLHFNSNFTNATNNNNLNKNPIYFASLNENSKLNQAAATAEKNKFIAFTAYSKEKEALFALSKFPLNLNNPKGFACPSEHENFFLGKKLNRISQKISDVKIESTDNDTDEIKKQPKVIYKNRKYVFTHKDNKAIEDSFKKVGKKAFNNFNAALDKNDANKAQKNNLEIFSNFGKANFYFNCKKENCKELFLKACFAISKMEKTKRNNFETELMVKSAPNESSYFNSNLFVLNLNNDLCFKDNQSNEKINNNKNYYLFQKEKANFDLNLNADCIMQRNFNFNNFNDNSNYSNNIDNIKINNNSKIIKSNNYNHDYNFNQNINNNSTNLNANSNANENAYYKIKTENIINLPEQIQIQNQTKLKNNNYNNKLKIKTETNKKPKRNILGKSRKSQFRGDSKNGNQWQALIMIKNHKRYVGSYASEELAARAYDKVAIQYHQSKAKTNFSYFEAEITQILKETPAI